MKVKIKLTVEQFSFLLQYVQKSNYTELNELQILNIRLFLPFALKKLIDCKPEFGFNTIKVKSFSIELNQYTAIMALLTNERHTLDPYTLSIFITLQNQNKNLLHLN
jgi:hypothetical protein